MKEKIIRKIKQSWVVILITIILSTSFALASDEVYKSISQFLDFVIKFFSWWWVFFAIIAWKLMTNDWIFWFGMDKYLFAMWNVMKNFANFAIGFAFLFLILYSFFKGQPGALIKQYLGKLLLAAVLINISWFVILVVLDIALILTMAVADIPSSLISKLDNEKEFKQTICNQAEKIESTTMIVDFNADWQMLKIESNDNATDADCNSLFDKFLPKADSVSWPLIYLGASVLNMYDISFLKADKIDFKSLSLDKILNVLIAIMFILPLFILMVVNFVRIFWIWMFIVFSPFVMIDAVFGNKFASKMWGKLQKLTLSNFIWLAFMPVAVVWTMSIAILFVMSLHNILHIWDNTNNAQQVKFEWLIVNDKEVGMEMLKCGENKACSKVDINFGQVASGAGEFVGGVIWWLILVILSIVFLWSILQIWFKTSQITASISDGIFKFTSEVAKAMPVLPGGVSFGALKQAKDKFTSNVFQTLQWGQANKLEQKINEIFGLDKNTLTQSELISLKSVIAWSPNAAIATYNFFNKLSKILKNKEGITLQSESVQQAFKLWIDRMLRDQEWKKFLDRWISDQIKDWKIKNRNELFNSQSFGLLISALLDKNNLESIWWNNNNIDFTMFSNVIPKGQLTPAISLSLDKLAKWEK